MKRVVLIDGENLARGIRNLAGSVEAPANREILETFNFRLLINEVLGDGEKSQALFFGARLHRYAHDENLLQQTEEAIRIQAKLVNSLRKQGIEFIKVGYLRARETKPCSQCGHTKWPLMEKGVDVGLAVRMVAEAGPDTEIILCSADTDLLPAVKMAVGLGAKVTTATRLITKQMVEKVLYGSKT